MRREETARNDQARLYAGSSAQYRQLLCCTRCKTLTLAEVQAAGIRDALCATPRTVDATWCPDRHASALDQYRPALPSPERHTIGTLARSRTGTKFCRLLLHGVAYSGALRALVLASRVVNSGHCPCRSSAGRRDDNTRSHLADIGCPPGSRPGVPRRLRNRTGRGIR